MGGIVAFEMARQLAAAGDDVPLLFLIDSPVPSQGRFPRSFDDHQILVDFAADLARTAGREYLASLEQLRGLDFEAMRNGSLARAIEGSEIGREIGAERLQRLHGVYRANRLALEAYEPGPYPGRAVLVRAGSSLGIFDDDAARGWNALVLGGVTTHHLPGDHYTIMQRPTVEKLAEILSGEIERLERTTGEFQSR
jgi:thioesterase domain-containing protein